MGSKNNSSTESYEEIRQRNIAANRSLLLSLQLSGPGLTPHLIPKSVPKVNPSSSAKLAAKSRTKRRQSGLSDEVPPDTEVNGTGRRRSGRILRQKQSAIKSRSDNESEEDGDDYEGLSSEGSESDSKENQMPGRGRKRKSRSAVWHPPTEPKRPRGSDPPKPKARCLKGSRPDPKIFGHQVGTEVGDWWDSRMMCSQAGVHAPPVSGIAGTADVGCFSVALSGGYEDDVDLGYAFTFTGSGGRALSGTRDNPKNLRVAPQSFDQEFTAMNAALRLSCELKNPIRVIRGYKNHSPFAPEEGYRYDGLYKVEKCWKEAGQSGFQVCKFAFVRLPDQPKIPVKLGREAEAEQMYRDMGFKIEDLPASAAQQPWSRALSNQRRLDKNSKHEGTPGPISNEITEEDVDKTFVEANPQPDGISDPKVPSSTQDTNEEAEPQPESVSDTQPPSCTQATEQEADPQYNCASDAKPPCSPRDTVEMASPLPNGTTNTKPPSDTQATEQEPDPQSPRNTAEMTGPLPNGTSDTKPPSFPQNAAEATAADL